MIDYATVCSGIEAPSVALGRHGWQAAWLSEIEPFPCKLLAHHYPETPNLGDMTGIAKMVRAGDVPAPAVLIGGTPCQAFSVAGLRNGLSDERGALTISFVEIADAVDSIRQSSGQPESVVWWENVPGVLTSKDNAFGCFLGALAGESCELQPPGKRWGDAGCVYGPKRAIAWRVLDAQYFGLAQRRKRVFVVASARDGFDPAKVLFEFDGVRRDIAPSRASQKGAALSFAVRTANTSSNGWGISPDGPAYTLDSANGQAVATGYRMVAFGEYTEDETASTMKARDHKDATDLVCSIHGTQEPIVGCEIAHALGRNSGQENAVVFNQNASGEIRKGVVAGSLTAQSNASATGVNLHIDSGEQKVRRLTPVECERLQGFPDNYTKIPWRDKPVAECPDGHRYKALGNSMAVPVMGWIGQRIAEQIKTLEKQT